MRDKMSMIQGLEQKLKLRQGLILSQEMRLYLELIQMPLVVLEEVVYKEVEENPLVELVYDDLAPASRDPEDFDIIRFERFTLKDYMLKMVDYLAPTQKMREIAEDVIWHLDDHGLLPLDLKTLAKEIGVDEKQLEEVLRFLKSVGPPGILARDENECFRERGEYTYPSNGFDAEEGVKYGKPDIVLTLDGERLTAIVMTPEIRIVEYGENVPRTSQWKEKEKKALILVNALKRRKETLKQVADILIEINRDYFLSKKTEPSLIKITELAKRLGFNKSTVSRAIKDKYVRSPRGMHELSSFFGERSMRMLAMKHILHILRTDPDMTDEQIARKLKEMGLKVSRRTVNKYRHEMGLKKK